MESPQHRNIQGDYDISQHRGYPQPQLKPPPSYPLPHPNHSPQKQHQAQLEAYNARNHGKFHERNRGSKKAGFLGMLALVFKCGCFANDVGGAVL